MDANGKRRVTIKQVAREASVSTQTVSRVINDRPDVASGTRQRVQAVIARLGYQPNQIARSLTKGRSRTLGVVACGLRYRGSLYTIFGVEREASGLGYAVLLRLIRQPETSDVDDLLGDLFAHRVDGIIWAVPEIGDNHAWFRHNADNLAVPIVFLSMPSRSGQLVIAVDNHTGGLMATRHLIAQGCHNIGIITGPMSWWEARERKRGWQDALEGAELFADEGLVVEGDWTAAGGERALGLLSERCPEVDGVLVCNDRMTLGALRAARKIGRQVPEDLLVISFDDASDAAFFYPPLPTVRQDTVKLGRRAVRELSRVLEREQNGEAVPVTKTVLLRPELVNIQ